jgi:CRISPR/Cas system-associated protein Cas10 (large subunit of type III CRISPR-Cas system)
MREVEVLTVDNISYAAKGVRELVAEVDRLRNELALLESRQAGKQQDQTAHGLYYVDRWVDNATVFRIDRESFPRIERPERDVLRALLIYASSKLDQLDATDEVYAHTVPLSGGGR